MSSVDKKVEPVVTKRVSFLELFKYATFYDWILISIGILFAMADGASLQILIIYFGDILGALVLFNPNIPGSADILDKVVRDAVTKMVVIGALTFAAATIHTYCWAISGENQAKRIRESFFKSLCSQDVAWFDRNSTGELTTRLTSDLNLIQDGISSKPGMAIKSVCAFVTGFSIAHTKSWQLAGVLTLCFPVLATVIIIMTKIRTGGSEAAQKAYAGAGDVAQQCLSSIRTVHAFGGQEREKHRYQEKLIAAEKVGLRSQLFNGVGLGSLQLVIFGVYALAFWYGNKLVPGTLNAGGVLNVLFAILIGSFSLGSAGPQISSIATAMGAAKIIFEIIDRKSLIDSLSDEGLKPEKVVGNIEFKNINFQYPSRPDVVILDNFNLNIESGKTVALVGTSGSGKSTIVKLFERFYDPASGTVTLDGVDIKLLNVNWLRRQVGMVSQEPVLFDATIRQNILYGIQNFSELSVKDQDARIEDACRQSNCWDFIQLLPKKLETSVGESGGMLSGGQKQRIAIARSIIKNPQVLLLDEATSALDTESERIVQAALEVASKNRTTIVIAHRLSTIKNADKIVVMEKGVIKEAGTHKELIDMGAIYADLVATQSLKGNMEEKIETKKEENDVVALKKNDIDGKEKEIEDKAAIAKVDAVKLDYNRLMSWSKPEIGIYILASFGAILNGSVQPLFSILFATILTKLGTTESDTYPLLLACLGVGAFLSNFMQNLYVLAGEKVTRRLRYASFVAILSQDIEFFDQEENATGVLMSKLAEDASLVPGLTGQTFGAIIQGLGGVIGGLIIAFISCWQLALVILGMVPIIMLAGYLQFQNMTGVGTKTKKAYELISQQAAEAISSIRTIMTITQEKHFVAHFNKTVAVPYSSAIKSAPITAISVGFSSSIGLFAWALSMFYGSQLLKWNLYTADQVLKAMFCIIFTSQAIGQVANFMPDAAKGKVAAVNIFALLDRNPKIAIVEEGETRKESDGYASLQNVKFSYPTRPQQQILKGLNVEAKPGQTVALVGKSGCGKSTVMGLLERWDNIAYGAASDEIFNNIDDKAIYDAAKLANIHEFVMELPKKYDTLVGEKGGKLSGGQKQRIAIARALVRNPRLLLLDEATSALDSESEKVVQTALDAASQGRTTIVIAHRLSTIQNANIILVVENGVIAEFGTHQELLNHNGLYADLVRRQQLATAN